MKVTYQFAKSNQVGSNLHWEHGTPAILEQMGLSSGK